jgi:hypothetical protein
MSMSVGSSNYNPYAYLEFLLQQNQSSSGTTGQGFPVAGTAQQSASVSGGSNTTALSGNSSLQFGPQTFGALLGLQMSDNGTSGFSPGSQSNADGSTGASAGGQNPFAALASADIGATGQITANANGSTTYGVTYADGATVTFTTAAPSAGSSSSDSASSSGGTDPASNNILEQLIQIQAQSLSSATAQSASDATSGSQVQQGQNGIAPPPFGGAAGPTAIADSGATGQTTSNANGSTTYTITYADGSTVTVTTPPSSDSSTSSDIASGSSGTSTASSNFIEQMIQLQAQLLNSLTTQSASDPSSGQQTQQDQFGSPPPSPLGGIAGLLASADNGATGQTTSNANGSTTYTITYADGSTVTTTTPASSASAASSDSASSSSSTNAVSNNLFEQLIEMQAQLLSSATTQTVATA